jgi:diguanylate cyclase (GGDEF)-like protein
MASGPRVLIVDDSKVVRGALAKVISRSFAPVEAADGEAGWAVIEKDPSIVAVICDLSMPKLDGFGLLQRIRSASSPRIRDLPFLVISGNEDDATRNRARVAGASDFISKSTKGVEAITRIDNLLRLVRAKQDLEANHLAIKVDDDERMWDRLTGAFTSAYLLNEGAKHFAHAQRHGTQLSAVALRIDNYAEIEARLGGTLAGQLLARVAKLVQSTLRAEDSMGRMGQASFALLQPSTTAEQAAAFARRIGERLDNARVSQGSEAILVRTSLGVASFGQDKAGSIEDLLKIAVERLARSAARPDAARAAAPADLSTTLDRVLGANDIAAAVQMLERASKERAPEVMERLGPLIKANCARLGIELQEFVFLLQSRP